MSHFHDYRWGVDASGFKGARDLGVDSDAASGRQLLVESLADQVVSHVEISVAPVLLDEKPCDNRGLAAIKDSVWIEAGYSAEEIDANWTPDGGDDCRSETVCPSWSNRRRSTSCTSSGAHPQRLDGRVGPR